MDEISASWLLVVTEMLQTSSAVRVASGRLLSESNPALSAASAALALTQALSTAMSLVLN